ADVRAELAELRHELGVFVDVETLFLRAPRGLASGGREPSNLARLRAYVRRMAAEGAGIAPAFLALLRRALAHYGIASLAPCDALERAVLRLFATQRSRALRHRLVLALVRRIGALGAELAGDAALRAHLGGIAELRGLVSDGLADAAIEALPDEPGAAHAAGAAPAHGALDLGRLVEFELEPLPARPGVVAFHARHRTVPGDERIFVGTTVPDAAGGAGHEAVLQVPAFERVFYAATRSLRAILLARDPDRRLQWNRIWVDVPTPLHLDADTVDALARRLAPATRHLGLEKVLVRVALLDREAPDAPPEPMEIVIAAPTGTSIEVRWRRPETAPLRGAGALERRVVEARRRRLVYPYEIVRMLTTPGGELPPGRFEEWDLDETGRARSVAGRPFGCNTSAVVFGVITTPTEQVPEGMRRVLVLSDPTRDMGALAAPECDRIVAALDLAERLGAPVEWAPVSAGARIAMDSGTENLDATARVARRIVHFTARGGAIHVIVHGVNVGAQSYWNALAALLGHTRGVLIMTGEGAMVLTGRAALEASGSVAAEDELGIGGFERVMGPNGEAQYFARDVAEAWRILYQHHRYTFVVPGEQGPRRLRSADPITRSICDAPYPSDPAHAGDGFTTIGELFDAATNGERKRPFAMRALMDAVVDRDGGHLERWSAMAGAENTIVWDAAIGGFPVCLIGIESRPVPREGHAPPDGPAQWSAGTLFPLAAKKLARALRAASGNRPLVVLANLSGFDGSPESMRKLQLEYGAEIARAVVE
ncbi:MAG TPA: carboxyl transferase domain-containing protein, partial [Myxococcota bacterium]